jgi:L-ascorbate metabolism protein UlaG (beta-lactamase superfamily)
VRLQWLGQAGFLLEFEDQTVVIDPYLSDSLAQKYAGSIFEHARMYTAPVDPNELKCDLVICTHRHTDHMDGQTLDALASANPGVRICVPRAEVEHARTIGIDPERIIEMSVGTTLEPLVGLSITPIPAAHERLSTDARGEHRFLGVVISTPDYCTYHSGDCVPYDGLIGYLKDAEIDIALLPVNGRDSYRLRNGVPGNFWIDEALELCDEAGIPTLVGHHFGLFDFNTVPPELLDRAAAKSPTNVTWIRPELTQWLTFLR